MKRDKKIIKSEIFGLNPLHIWLIYASLKRKFNKPARFLFAHRPENPIAFICVLLDPAVISSDNLSTIVSAIHPDAV